MAKAQDFTAVAKDAFAAFPLDTKAFDEAVKNAAVLNEKLSDVALGAAEQTNEVASKAAKDTIGALAKVGKAKAEPADYATALNTFANFAVDQAAKNFATYAEITRKAQAEAAELLYAAGKKASTEAAAAVQKAADEATKVAKKAAAAK